MADRTEAYYDAVIAPKLLEIAKLCHEADMPFLASVEYAPNACGLTADHPDIHECGPSFRIARYAAFSRGNIDTLITALRRDDEKHVPPGGHTQSIYMTMLADHARALQQEMKATGGALD